ncbi:cysteine peptidase family C39 domain-containing protein [Candidatus Lariskella endosymbiont of Epinotia ramella]|uniref:cysteine peptidase family C39 domain-containing protein n=1 Tax=Candidatus Lariskella endosymbiont of Epinotia ramella TaxID=3066224 RepID=UPI0030D6292F
MILQMEATECGAAALAIVLAYYGCIVPLEEMRQECDVTRDGSKASNIVTAARKYGCTADGYAIDMNEIHKIQLPAILFWNFNHFVVLDSINREIFYINDPATGPRTVNLEEFSKSFTGVCICIKPTDKFQKVDTRKKLSNIIHSTIKGNYLRIIFLLLCGFFISFFPIIFSAISKIFFDYYLIAKQNEWFPAIITSLILAKILEIILSLIKSRHLLKLELNISTKYTIDIFKHIMRLPLIFFTQRYSGDIASRMNSTNGFARYMIHDIGANFMNLFIILLSIAAIFSINSLMAAFVLCFISLNAFITYQKSSERLTLNRKLAQEKGHLYAFSLNSIKSIETVKSSNSENIIFCRLAAYHMNALNTQSKLAQVDLILSSTGSLCNSLIFVTTFVFGAYEIILGYLSIGGLLAFKAIAFLLNNYILKIISSFNNLQAAYADLLRLHDIQLYPEDVRYSLCSDSIYVDKNVITQTKSNKNRKIAPNKIRINSKQEDCFLIDSNQSLLMECRDISFGYSKLSAPIAHKFNLKVKEAELIAIVGKTGGGKSTIAKLLAGLNHPTEGLILFKRREMQSISQSELYDAISYVDQDITLFSGSIFENLTMWDETVSNDMVFQAISDACLEKVISEKGLAFQLQENGLRVFLIDCVNFLEPLKSPIKFDYKMSHSFIPVRDRHGPFFGNIINR